MLTGYRDIARVANDDATFLSAPGITIPGVPEMLAKAMQDDALSEAFNLRTIPIDTDPPEFFKYRKVLNPLLSPAAVAGREGEIRDISRDLLRQFVGRGEVELVEEFAKPMPGKFTLRMLGLPEENWRSFVDPIHFGIHQAMSTEDPVSMMTAMAAAFEHVAEVVRARMDAPRDDIISHLFAIVMEDGSKFTFDQVMGMCFLFLIGGVDTTTAAIGNALIYLGRHPDQRAELIRHLDDPAYLRTTVEEFLRYEAPVQALARTAAIETEVGGVKLVPGDRVLMCWASGNRDPAEFENPDQVVLDRPVNRHMTFGLGIHRCLGGPPRPARATRHARGVSAGYPRLRGHRGRRSAACRSRHRVRLPSDPAVVHAVIDLTMSLARPHREGVAGPAVRLDYG